MIDSDTKWRPGMRALSITNVQIMVTGGDRVHDTGVADTDGYRVIAVDTMMLLVVAETPGATSDWEPTAHFVRDMSDAVTRTTVEQTAPETVDPRMTGLTKHRQAKALQAIVGAGRSTTIEDLTDAHHTLIRRLEKLMSTAMSDGILVRGDTPLVLTFKANEVGATLVFEIPAKD